MFLQIGAVLRRFCQQLENIVVPPAELLTLIHADVTVTVSGDGPGSWFHTWTFRVPVLTGFLSVLCVSQMLNQSLLANRRSSARLVLVLQEENLHQEAVLRRTWEDCQNRWRRTRADRIIDQFRWVQNQDIEPGHRTRT